MQTHPNDIYLHCNILVLLYLLINVQEQREASLHRPNSETNMYITQFSIPLKYDAVTTFCKAIKENCPCKFVPDSFNNYARVDI